MKRVKMNNKRCVNSVRVSASLKSIKKIREAILKTDDLEKESRLLKMLTKHQDIVQKYS